MTDEVALVTGAAGGIGSAVVGALVESGRRVVALDMDTDGLDRLQRLHLAGVSTMEGDSSKPSDMASAAEQATRTGNFSAVVVCTGIVDRMPILTGDPGRWAEVLRVNVVSAMLAGQTLQRHRAATAPGDVVVIGSVSGRIYYQGEPAYLASKHATSAAMEVLRQELAATSTRVTLVQPGLVETALTAGVSLPDGIRSGLVPLYPDDVASAVMFALSAPRRVMINEVVMRPMGQVL